MNADRKWELIPLVDRKYSVRYAGTEVGVIGPFTTADKWGTVSQWERERAEEVKKLLQKASPQGPPTIPPVSAHDAGLERICQCVLMYPGESFESRDRTRCLVHGARMRDEIPAQDADEIDAHWNAD